MMLSPMLLPVRLRAFVDPPPGARDLRGAAPPRVRPTLGGRLRAAISRAGAPARLRAAIAGNGAPARPDRPTPSPAGPAPGASPRCPSGSACG